MESDSGKGDSRRENIVVDGTSANEKYRDGWDRIFGAVKQGPGTADEEAEEYKKAVKARDVDEEG